MEPCKPHCECGVCRARQFTRPAAPTIAELDAEREAIHYLIGLRFANGFELEWLETRTADLYNQEVAR